MDFVSYVRDQREKLNSRDYILQLWDELEGVNDDTTISTNVINDFNNHLPLLIEQFWEIALEKLNETSTIEEIDEELKTYLLVLIYHCITQSHELISYKCVLFAVEIYLHLLTTPQVDEFFKNKLYLRTLSTLQSSLETTSENVIVRLLSNLRKFLSKTKLIVTDLEVTLATLVQIIFVTSKETFKNFQDTNNQTSITLESLLCLKILLEEENITSRKLLITTYLFNGLKRHPNIVPRQFNIIQINFRSLLKSLHQKFKEDHYKTFLNAFIHVWRHPEFTFFGEAVFIMNSLKEKHYSTLIDILNRMLMTKNPPKNLFKLSLSVMCYPPHYMTVEKIKVTNQILLKQIQLSCVCSNVAVESLAEILMSPDLEKEYIKQPMMLVLNCRDDEKMNPQTFLKGLRSLISKKWGTRSNNKHIFVVVVSVILFSEQDHPVLYKEMLELLTDNCSPFDLKPFLQLMSETYLNLREREFTYSALQILKIMFKMALHPMASSTEFVKYLYTSMVYPNVCKGVTLKSEHFIDPIISDNFNFSEFFEKCRTLGLLKSEHASRLISTSNESRMKLVCAIIHLTEYKELSSIANKINDNFMTICNSPDLNYLFYIYMKMFENNNSSRSNQNLRYNEIMVSFIKHHLLNQTFRWNCVANAFALLNTLRDYTELCQDYARLKEQYDKSLASALRNRGSFLPFMYFSQLVVFSKLVPNEGNLKEITDFLMSCGDELQIRSPEFKSKIWTGCLLLYTNICIVKTNLVERGLDYLQNGMNCSITAVKLASINMTFDLCNMITHNFEDLIKYMFTQLVYGDDIFKKTCLLKIDRLMRDDYLKLDLEQYLVLVSLLADKNIAISDYSRHVFSENFFMSNTALTTKYFVPLIVHINGYTKHPHYQISNYGIRLVQLVSRNILDKRKMYDLLFNTLPIKNRFTIIQILSTHILEPMMKSVIKIDEGFWKMIKDSVYIFKSMAAMSCDDQQGESFYKKITNYISKHLLQKSEYGDKTLYTEHHKEVVRGTETLLKLLFFNDSENVQKHIRISVFDAIIHWVNFLMPDLVHIIHVERNKEIQNYFIKLDKFYRKNGHDLRYSEESFANGNLLSDENISCNSALFTVSNS